MKRLILSPYQTSWADDFYALSQLLLPVLSPAPGRLEHVGSTAVPGMVAKPIIDLDLVYDVMDDFPALKTRLETRGYYHNGDQGIPGREVFKRQTTASHTVLDAIPHHLYVNHHEGKELARHLYFRDYLRAHPQARADYNRIKYELAELTAWDRSRYALLKETYAVDFFTACFAEK